MGRTHRSTSLEGFHRVIANRLRRHERESHAAVGQPVGLGATTTWSWAIEAVDPGSQILTVSYEAEVKVAGQKIPKSFRTITRTITVSVAPRDFIKRLADDSSSAKTIAENVSWIWTTMIFPGGMFVYGLLKWLRGRNASPRSS